MHQESIQATGHLIRNEESIPIHAKCASKYSLMIRFLNRKNLGNGVEFSKLILQLNGESIEMGACRLISEPTIDSFNKRLIFTQDVYDLESLFFKNKLAKLQASFFNLPLLLGHKDKILRAFKDYTADLTYDLNVYRNLFDSLDSEHRSEPNDIQREIQEVIINTEGRKFMDFLDKKLDELEGIVRGFGKEEHEYHGYYFRRQLWPFILNAPFMARTNLKPRGYAGDSEMMSMIYENSYAGNSTFEKLMHKHPVEHPAAQAVRNRRKFISAVLPRVRKDCTSDSEEGFRALSVACGPACEIGDVLSNPEDFRRYRFTLLDQDRTALMEAARRIDQIEKKVGSTVAVDYLNESVRTMLTAPHLEKRWGEFDVIYSMGLFDYLTPPVASAVIGKLYRLLKPGGEMMIGNFHVSNPSRTYMEYWLDWVLYYRTEEEFLSLLKDAPTAETFVTYDDTGVQMFLHVKKPA